MVGLIALIVLAGIAGGIWWLVAELTRDDGEPVPTPSVSTPAPPEPSESPGDDSEAAACTTDNIAVRAATDQQEYGKGQNPVFTLELENIGEEDCEANVGTVEQDFVVSQGEDRIISSAVCQSNAENHITVLVPGQVETVTWEWGRFGANADCTEFNQDLPAGEYQLTTALGESTSEPVTFVLAEPEDAPDEDTSEDS